MYPPDDLATCALIKILWDFHAMENKIPRKMSRVVKPEWIRNETQEKLLKMCKETK